MAGLSLMAGGQARVRANSTAGPGSYSDGGHPASVGEAAFGPQASALGPRTGATLAPNDAFGIALWSGVAAVGFLLVLRHSLPR